MASRLLDKFLERANKVRGDLPELTETTFSELLRNRHTEQFERWLPVFKKLARCKPTGASCSPDPKKGAVFDDAHFTLKVQSQVPFAKCQHRSQDKGGVELASHSLIVNFLKLYKQATHTLLKSWGHDAMWWS